MTDTYTAAIQVANIASDIGTSLGCANTTLGYLTRNHFKWVTYVVDDVDVTNVESPRIKITVIAEKGETRFRASVWVDRDSRTSEALEVLKGMLGE